MVKTRMTKRRISRALTILLKTRKAVRMTTLIPMMQVEESNRTTMEIFLSLLQTSSEQTQQEMMTVENSLMMAGLLLMNLPELKIMEETIRQLRNLPLSPQSKHSLSLRLVRTMLRKTIPYQMMMEAIKERRRLSKEQSRRMNLLQNLFLQTKEEM